MLTKPQIQMLKTFINGGFFIFFLIIISTISFSPLSYPSLVSLSLLSLSLLIFSFFKRVKKAGDEDVSQSQTSISALKLSLTKIYEKKKSSHQSNSTQFLLELLPSSSPKLGALFSPVKGCDGEGDFGSRFGDSGGENEEGMEKKKRKKRVKKNKKKNCCSFNGGEEREGLKNKEELVCLYPFTSSSSATQRKIKQEYDQLVKLHESKGLTLAQVGQFINCLVDARNELLTKSECIKRKFTITKALLLKADRSSFDRLRQQIYRLELEQKRLEEDAIVYNWLQHQLKLSPAYKKMLEISAGMELKAKYGEIPESIDTEQNVSFEEFLAQEKKDTFWQNYGKLKSCSELSRPT